MQTRIVTVFLLLSIVIGGSLALRAQESRGTIVGKITDPTGAVVPGARVLVVNQEMGTRVALTTNAEGMYLAPLLSPGLYRVEVTAPGFKKAMLSDIQVRVADRLDNS